jgi:hypothetical protein
VTNLKGPSKEGWPATASAKTPLIGARSRDCVLPEEGIHAVKAAQKCSQSGHFADTSDPGVWPPVLEFLGLVLSALPLFSNPLWRNPFPPKWPDKVYLPATVPASPARRSNSTTISFFTDNASIMSSFLQPKARNLLLCCKVRKRPKETRGGPAALFNPGTKWHFTRRSRLLAIH